MSRLAFVTFAVFARPSSDCSYTTFMELAREVVKQLDDAEGFISASILIDGTLYHRPPEQDRSAWGRPANPTFTGEQAIAGLPTVLTLSLWNSIGSVKHFSYSRQHKTALFRRKEWFLPPRWPTYAMWWIPHNFTPTFEDASRRMEHLHAHGPSTVAFDFKTVFFADGTSSSL